MSESTFIDFQAIKSQVSILQILEHYGLMGQLRQTGEFITGQCPIHANNRQIAFRANITINCWNCFNQCGCSGDIIDFVSRKERVSAQKAARLIMRWFNLSFDPPIAEHAKPTAEPSATAEPTCAESNRFCDLTNDDLRPRFAVKRYWEMSDTVHVPADSVETAVEAAHALPLDNTKAAYVPDSMNSDPTTDVHPLYQ
jgi:hypothetical protein